MYILFIVKINNSSPLPSQETIELALFFLKVKFINSEWKCFKRNGYYFIYRQGRGSLSI